MGKTPTVESVNVPLERENALQAFHSEQHVKSGSYIRELIFGFNDGLVSVFALVSGIAGAALSSNIILLTGIAGLTAGAVSMALGAYISSKSQIEYYNSEIKREKEEIEKYPEVETEEIRQLYKLKGFKGQNLETVVKIITSDKKIWLKVMMEEELGLVQGKFDNPKIVAVIMGVAFVVGATLPIIPYFFMETVAALPLSAVLSLAGLFAIGSLKTIITKMSWLKSGAEMVGIGILSAAATYTIGFMLASLGAVV